MNGTLKSAVFAVVAVAVLIGGGVLFGELNQPQHEIETFKYSISAEDIKDYNDKGHVIVSARITITLDHAPESPIDIIVGTYDKDGGYGGRVVTVSGTSASFVIPRNQSGMEWEEGRIWDPGYSAWFSGAHPWKALEKA